MRNGWITLTIAVLLLVTRSPSALETRESRGENGELISRYQVDDGGEFHGFYETCHTNGRLESKGMYNRGCRSGTWVYFDSLGATLRVEAFDSTGGLHRSSDIEPLDLIRDDDARGGGGRPSFAKAGHCGGRERRRCRD